MERTGAGEKDLAAANIFPGDVLLKKINDPAVPGSTFNLWQENSFKQLYPHATVPSLGEVDPAFPDYDIPFTTPQPNGACYPDAVATPLQVEGLGERLHRRLGRPVGAHGKESRDRAEIDDSPLAALPHAGHRGVGEAQDDFAVDLEHLQLVGHGDVDDRRPRVERGDRQDPVGVPDEELVGRVSPTGPGIGFDVNEDRIEALTVRRETVRLV